MSNKLIISKTLIFVILSIGTKILGFFREQLIAYRFGTSYDADIAMFANGLVMLLFAGLGEAVINTYIPLLSEINLKKPDYKEKFTNNILNIILIISIILAVFTLVFAKEIVEVAASGFRSNSEIFNRAIITTKIVSFSYIFMGIQYVLKGYLDFNREFNASMISDILSNIVFIIFLMFLANSFGLYGFAVATVISYFIKLLVTIPKMKKSNFKYKLYINIKDEYLKKMLLLVVPIFISTSVAQINVMVDRAVATNLGEGVISILSFANRLSLLVYSIFAMVIATIIYPILAELLANNHKRQLAIFIEKNLSIIITFIIPACIGLMVLNIPVIEILFKRGAFNENSVQLTATALVFYLPSMITYTVTDFINKIFFSMQKTNYAMKISIIGVIINIVLNLILPKYIGLNGIALSTTIASIIVMIISFIVLIKKVEFIRVRVIMVSIFKVVISSIIMVIIIKMILSYINNIGIISLIAIILLSAIGYIISIIFLKVNGVEEIICKLKNVKINKKR